MTYVGRRPKRLAADAPPCQYQESTVRRNYAAAANGPQWWCCLPQVSTLTALGGANVVGNLHLWTGTGLRRRNAPASRRGKYSMPPAAGKTGLISTRSARKCPAGDQQATGAPQRATPRAAVDPPIRSAACGRRWSKRWRSDSSMPSKRPGNGKHHRNAPGASRARSSFAQFLLPAAARQRQPSERYTWPASPIAHRQRQTARFSSSRATRLEMLEGASSSSTAPFPLVTTTADNSAGNGLAAALSSDGGDQAACAAPGRRSKRVALSRVITLDGQTRLALAASAAHLLGSLGWNLSIEVRLKPPRHHARHHRHGAPSATHRRRLALLLNSGITTAACAADRCLPPCCRLR